MVRRTRPGISRFSDVQLHICAPRNDGSTHPEIVPLADFHAVMPENAVRGRGVEIEVRKRKAVEELLALQRDGSVGPGGKGDVACICAFELRGLERLQIVAGLRKPLSQFFESLLGVGRSSNNKIGK